MIAAPEELHRLRHKRKWSKGEKRVLLVLLSGAAALSARDIDKVARVRGTTVFMVLDLLAAHDLVSQTELGYYWLTQVGRAFSLQIVGLA
jgi:predicted transcriptional regulator